ncbi:MAG: hypothetical protein ABW002_04620 [Xanthomonas sp.]
MSLLTKQQILAAHDHVTEDVEVKEWGGTVRVSTMSAADRDKWEDETLVDGATNKDNFRARFVARCLVDENGCRLFTPEDIAELGAKSGAALARVHSVAWRLNGFGAAATEEAEKKS